LTYRIQTRRSPSRRAQRAGFPTSRRSRTKHRRRISAIRTRLRRRRLPQVRIPFLAPRLPDLRATRDPREMKEIFVADAAKFENQAIVAFFAVTTKQLRSRKDGGQYLATTLGDRTGQIESRMWDNFAEIAAGFEEGDVVKVRAEVCRFNGRFQLNLEKLRRATPDEFEMADYVPHTRKDVEELWSTLIRSVDSFSNPWLQALVRSFLEDPAIASAFREAPAAKSLHHAWMGGLLEHVVSLMGICELAAQHYPEINRDLLLTGVIFHDIGKLQELRWGMTFDYTLEGQLVGHIAIAIGMIEKKLAAMPEFPPTLRILVEHMVLSHHGRLEFGSPKLPMIPEAVLLHYMDDLDAKMHTMRSEFERHEAQGAEPGEMTDWVRSMERPLLNTVTFLRPKE
jgi:3'-5' exoribonuclease